MAQENSKAKESLAKWSILYTKSHFGNHNKLLVPDNPGAEPKELHKPSPSPELCPHHLHPNHPWGGKPEPLTQPICRGLGGHNNPVQVHAQGEETQGVQTVGQSCRKTQNTTKC